MHPQDLKAQLRGMPTTKKTFSLYDGFIVAIKTVADDEGTSDSMLLTYLASQNSPRATRLRLLVNELAKAKFKAESEARNA